jgi:hypothetical protein
MKKISTYLFTLLIFGIVILFYFSQTNTGRTKVKHFIENELSKKTNSNINIQSLNLDNYPFIVVNLQINNRANVILKGKLDNKTMDMKYHLKGSSFSFDHFVTKDRVDIKGTLVGSTDALLVTGEGIAFDGMVKYSFKDLPHIVENVLLQMTNVSSSKILTALKQENFINERLNLNAKFKFFSKYKQEGEVQIDMRRLLIPYLYVDKPFILKSNIYFHDIDYNYTLDIYSDLGSMLVRNGHFNRSQAILTGEYALHLNDLKDFKKLLKHQYRGNLDTNGTIYYNSETDLLKIEGRTQKLEGELNYAYKKDNIDLKLNGISLKSLLEQFSYPTLFSSKVYGTVNFDTKENIVIINTKLKETRFPKSKLTDVIQERLDTNMLTKVYDKSYFSAGYKDSVLSATLKIDNGTDYLHLTETILDIKHDTINAKFKIKMDGTEVEGELYDTITDPQLKIDKKAFATKKMDRWLRSH